MVEGQADEDHGSGQDTNGIFEFHNESDLC
jgi:hypothetical protein